jgi:hypothetical protein
MKKAIIGVVFFIIATVTEASTNPVHGNGLSASGLHNILSSQLPAGLLTEIKNHYQDYWITDLYEEGNVKRPSYYITVENADQIIKMSSDDSENWVVTSTTIKNN